jgi:hypothetical protein
MFSRKDAKAQRKEEKSERMSKRLFPIVCFALSCAAKVFINWLLSRRGQIALQKRTANAENPADSLRVDIPKDEVAYESRRLEGIKYLDTGKPEWIEMKPILGLVNDALKVAGKN